MRPVIQRFFCFLLSFTAVISYAQLHVAKDHIACAYGLKDDSDEWAVPAIYIDGHGLQHGFALYNGAGYAYFSDSGKQVTPFQFDAIDDQFMYEALAIELNNKKGVIDYSGRQLLAPEYDFVSSDFWQPNDTTRIIVHEGQCAYDSICTTLIGADGHFYFRNLKGSVQGFGTGYFSQYGSQPYSILQLNDYDAEPEIGIIDTNGHIIIPPVYEEIIMLKDDHFLATRNGLYTILDRENRELHPPILSRPRFIQHFEDYRRDGGSYVVQLADSGWRLLDEDFHPRSADYDSMSLANGIEVFLDGKTGMLDASGTVLIPIMYEYLSPLLPGRYNRFSRGLRFLCRLNGKYGLIDAHGKTIIPAQYDLPKAGINRETGNCYLKKGKNLFLVTNDSTQPLLQKLDYLFTKDSLSAYLWGEEGFVLHQQADGSFTKEHDFKIRGTYFSIDYSGRWFDRKGKPFMPGKIYFMEPLSQRVTEIWTRSHLHGAVDSKTGKLIIDTVYRDFTRKPDEYKFIWGQLSTSGKWQVFDTLGQLHSPLLFEEVPENYRRYAEPKFDGLPGYYIGHTQPKSFSINGSQGIIDQKFRLIVPAVYTGTVVLPGDHFLLISKGNKIGLANAQNQLIADTIYTDYRPVFGNYHPIFDYDPATNDYRPFPEQKKEFWWLFFNGEKRLLVSNKGDAFSSVSPADANAAIIDSLLLNFAFNESFFVWDNQSQSYYYDFDPDGSQNSAEGAFRIPWPRDTIVPYKNEFIALLRENYEEAIPPYRPKSNNELGITTREIVVPDTLRVTQIQHLGKNSLSLRQTLVTVKGIVGWEEYQKYSYNTEFPTEGDQTTYANYIYHDGALKPLTLEDIFGKGAVLQEELLLALNKSEIISSYCPSPEELISIYASRFCILPEGILLLNYYNENGGLLIPLERLNAHPESKWITGYLK